jgi:hypothetical protein
MGGSVTTAAVITTTTTVAGAATGYALSNSMTIEEMERYIENNLDNIYQRERVIELIELVLEHYRKQGVKEQVELYEIIL